MDCAPRWWLKRDLGALVMGVDGAVATSWLSILSASRSASKLFCPLLSWDSGGGIRLPRVLE
jgi:hypothetical protein